MATMRVFVSHSHEDDAFCRAVVAGLRGAGADVWYDEHNMGSGQLIDTIERELRARSVFVLVLSPAALRSQWVRDETKWAYARFKRDPTRIILPILASALPDEDAVWLFLQDFKRIEAAGLRPYPTEEAVRRMLHILALAPTSDMSQSTAPQPMESITELLERAKALMAQQRYAEALPLVEHATQHDARSLDAWLTLGFLLNAMTRYKDAQSAYEHATASDPRSVIAWNNLGGILVHMGRDDEALSAYDRALAIDPNAAYVWRNKANVLRRLDNLAEAEQATQWARDAAWRGQEYGEPEDDD